jgi:branched-chain amino acid transport system permease protein
MAVLGFALQYLLLNFTLNSGFAPLLATFGLSVIIQNALLEQYSPDVKGLDAGALETDSITITHDISIGWLALITFLVAVVLLVGLQLLIRHTSLGRSLRATSDDQRTAQLVGIDNRKLYAIAMAMALATAAIAGVFLGIRTSFGPSDGPLRLIFAFEAVIIGGLGSLWGTLAGGIVLGVAQGVGAQISVGWGVLAGHLVFLAILLVRPRGLFPGPEPA